MHARSNENTSFRLFSHEYRSTDYRSGISNRYSIWAIGYGPGASRLSVRKGVAQCRSSRISLHQRRARIPLAWQQVLQRHQKIADPDTDRRQVERGKPDERTSTTDPKEQGVKKGPKRPSSTKAREKQVTERERRSEKRERKKQEQHKSEKEARETVSESLARSLARTTVSRPS